MAAPTTNLDRTKSVTLANPTPPTNVPVYYQGTPPTIKGTTPHWVDEPQWLPTTPRGEFMDPFNGAVATQWTGTDALPVKTELAGKAEADGTEVTTVVGGTTGYSVLGAFTENPNTDHPSRLGVVPVGGGFPDSLTTGVQDGITLTSLTGDQTISTPGVYQNKSITGGSLIINANGVTVKNCSIVGTGSAAVYVISGKTGVIIEYCDITGNSLSGIKALWCDDSVGTIVRYCDLHHAEDGIYVTGNNHEIRDNYIHDLISAGADPHHDCVQIGGIGTGIIVDHNSLIGAADGNACIQFGNGFGAMSATFNNNLMRPGPVMLVLMNCGDNAGSACTYNVTNNKLEPGHLGSGTIGQKCATWNVHPPATWTGNTNADTGATIAAP